MMEKSRKEIQSNNERDVVIVTSTSSPVNSEVKEKTLRQRFRDFGADSTIHGVRYITNPKFNIFRK